MAVIFGIMLGISMNVSADENLIPSWIKSTAGFWVDGQINDYEFIIALQYLVKEGILVIPDSEIKKESSLDQDTFSKTKYFSDLDVEVDLNSTVVILPSFTASAYADGGFYDFFRGECDESCLTVMTQETEMELSHATSMEAVIIFKKIGFEVITDSAVHLNPSILKKYDKVILLHNEYVTQTEFDAITNHPKVLYLYPNALYAKVDYDFQEKTIKLIRGHGYPTAEINNGFDWEFENTHPYEYDTDCFDWEFYKIDNGLMLNCYPENIISQDIRLIRQILLY